VISTLLSHGSSPDKTLLNSVPPDNGGRECLRNVGSQCHSHMERLHHAIATDDRFQEAEKLYCCLFLAASNGSSCVVSDKAGLPHKNLVGQLLQL
jgi:hypothetical protein